MSPLLPNQAVGQGQAPRWAAQAAAQRVVVEGPRAPSVGMRVEVVGCRRRLSPSMTAGPRSDTLAGQLPTAMA
jgi:hypothetical protein